MFYINSFFNYLEYIPITLKTALSTLKDAENYFSAIEGDYHPIGGVVLLNFNLKKLL